MSRRGCIFAFAAGLASTACATVHAGELTSQLRRPVAAAPIANGEKLLVANERSGSISVVDLPGKRIMDEQTVGQALSDLIPLAGSDLFLAVDPKRNQLLVLQIVDDTPKVIGRHDTVRHPSHVAVSKDGRRCFVSGLWSHCVQAFEIDPGNNLRLTASEPLRLRFAARELVVLPGHGKLVVAGAFGGEIGVIDAVTLQLEHVHRTTLSNIRGIGLSRNGEDVYLAAQEISEHAATTAQEIDLGRLINNVVCIVSVEAILNAKASLTESSRILPVGGAGHGAGDPSSIMVLDDRRVAVTLGGTSELAVVNVENGQVHTSPVGRNPVAAVLIGQSEKLVVLNRLEDSLSLLPVAGGSQTGTVSLGPQTTLSPGDHGELLFYNSRLSRDGWMSCHSCHTDGHTNGRLVDTLGDGSYGAPKRVLTLLGSGLTDTWAWNGQVKELHQQVDQSITATMHGHRLSAEQIVQLTAFLHRLSPPPPLEPADEQSKPSIERGRQIFESNGCGNCHVPPLTYTKNGAVDAGISDEHGNDKFNPPSLRGVSQQSGYFHDKRAATLEEVFNVHGHQLKGELSAEELRDLVRFLKSL